MGSVEQEFTPHNYPPFPQGLPSVELECYRLRDLENGDKAAQDRLFETCKTRGFFYLDFSDSSAESLPSDAAEIAMLAEETFRLPLKEKMKHAYRTSDKTIFGYKVAGNTKTDSKGTPDTAEFFNVAKDEMLPYQENRHNWPQLILDQKPLLSRYMTSAHEVGLKVMAVIESKLGLPNGTMAKLHRISERAGDHVRMTRGPPRKSEDLNDLEIQTPGHTDFGTITILFNWLGGLQVWSEPSRGENGFTNCIDPNLSSTWRDKDQWLWVVPPKPGCAIVNLGDASVKFSNKVLCSGRHRVIPAPGAQETFPRYSIVYFVRPENEAVLRRLDAPGIPPLEDGVEEEQFTADEWIMKQAAAMRSKIPDE